MWKLYQYIDASGNRQYTYILSSQEPAIQQIITRAGGTGARLLGTHAALEDFIDQSRYAGIQSAEDLLQDKTTFEADEATEDTFADLGNLGATLRNFLKGQGISPGGTISEQAEELLLPAAQAALGFGQGLNPASAETLNLTNLLASGGLGGIAQRSRQVFNQLAASGGAGVAEEGDMEGSMQRPATEGSNYAGGTRNLALGALFERSPFFAAMFGRNAVGQASNRFFENQRAAQGSGGYSSDVSRNMAAFVRDKIGANLFQGSSF